MSVPIFHWLTAVLGGLMVYEGLTGDCVFTKIMEKCCPAGGKTTTNS
jgi:hypothetical protein